MANSTTTVFIGSGFRRNDSWGIISPWPATSTSWQAARTALYTGCTTDLPARIYSHRNGLISGFTLRYGVKRLVHVETYDDVSDAIVRERRIKEWRRDWKIQLIEKENPFWEDLAVSLLGFDPLPSQPSHGEKRALLEALRASGTGGFPGTDAASSQSFLYNEKTGLPK